jgi:dCTP deaminase
MITNSSLAFASMHNLETTDSRVYPSQDIENFINEGYIKSDTVIPSSNIQPASLDLRLGKVGYELRTSFLPGGYTSINTKLQELKLCLQELDLSQPIVLLPGHVYLIELMEQLDLPSTMWAKANPRSTTGRADLFTRLLCDFSTEFEGVPPGYKGKLYVEIVPRTFAVMVRNGTRVNQIRLVETQNTVRNTSLLHTEKSDFMKRSILTVNLIPESVDGVIGYRAKRHAPVLDFDCVGCHNQLDFWEPIYLGDMKNIVLHPDDFYILKSQERVTIPATYAAELTPYDSAFGEFRVHYAGFLDPGFGIGGITEGTPVVLEVRARDVPFLIEHGQRVAWIVYYPLFEAARKLYGSKIGSSYHSQGISLGKQFNNRRGE